MPISKRSSRLWFGLVPTFVLAVGAVLLAMLLGQADSAVAIAAIAPFAATAASFVYGQSRKGGQIRAAKILSAVEEAVGGEEK